MAGNSRKRWAGLVHTEEHANAESGPVLKQIILGGQDGLVNVLGIVLGLAAAVAVNPAIGASAVIVGGFAATFAESISMAAVAYTSSKAQRNFYYTELEREKREIREVPEIEREEIRLIYMQKGFRGKQLDRIADKICNDETIWLETMMKEELGLSESKNINPLKEGAIVGCSAMAGSLVPLIPFLFMNAPSATILSLAASALALFGTGAYEGKTNLGKWWKTGLEMMVIGMAAAFIGYVVGAWAGVVF